jgi:hypothetical protein
MNVENWMISPVCSRLREHIYMLNGMSQKERLFLQSPMPNQVAWPLVSPAFEHHKAHYLGSTAPNTSTGSKYLTIGTQDGLSDIKGVHGMMESPYVIRRFTDGEHGMIGATSIKIHEKSEFKSYYRTNSNLKDQ